MNENKKTFEPLNLFGERSLIYTKDEAAKILKDNSYYVFLSVALLIGVFVLLLFAGGDIFVSRTTILVCAAYYLIVGVAIRYLKSRVASVLALVSYGYVLVSRIVDNDIGGLFWATFIFVAASYRCVRASFFYNRKVKVVERQENVQPSVPPGR